MSGIRNINKILCEHKESFGNNFEIYFHQDLDGVTTALAMVDYLKSYGMKLVDAHIIQYGGMEYAVPKLKFGSLGVLVDFANFKSMFSIATDHHDKQRGDVKGTKHTKPARCNAETISGEITSMIFTEVDMEAIQTIDSANFLKHGLSTFDIQNTLFNLNRQDSVKKNRFNLGLVCNKLILSYKTKRITHQEHHNKYLLECLVMDSTSSMYSIHNNLQRYIKHGISLEWNMLQRSHNVPQEMLTQKQIMDNITSYKHTRIDTSDITFNDNLNLIAQVGIGDVFKTGSYDRYIPFELYPNADFLATLLPFGFIQVSCNPFIKKIIGDVNLAEITKELLYRHKYALGNINISVADIKKESESEIKKMIARFGINYQPLGFTFEDLRNCYPNSIIYLPNRMLNDKKTRAIMNLNEDNTLEMTMNTPYMEWSESDIEEMTWYKIPLLDIISQNSGGHKSITNIQGLGYLNTRIDLLDRFFKTENSFSVMKILFDDFLKIMDEIYIQGGEFQHKEEIVLGGIELLD
jgi:hypothetical protein